ncbi:MAG: hypothetical protein ACOYXC_08480 [Candidatus Rifleibacteriota bacterium]
MRFTFRLLILLICCLAAKNCLAVELEDLSSHSFIRRIYEIAGRQQLNVIVIAKDKDLPDQTDFDLESIVKTAGYSCIEIGSTKIIVDPEKARQIEPADLSFLPARFCPASLIADQLKETEGEASQVKILADGRLLAFYGNRKEIAKAAEEAVNFDLEKKQLKLSLYSVSFQQTRMPPVSFSTMAGSNSQIEFEEKSGGKIRISAAVNEDSEGRIIIDTSVYTAPDFATPIGKTSTVLQTDSNYAGRFDLTTSAGNVSGSLKAEIEKTSANPAQKAGESKRAIQSLRTSGANIGTEKKNQLVSIKEPVGEVCAKLVKQNGGNFCADQEARQEASLFLFGEELYFEEILNLTAKAAGLVTRKIGNTWMMAEAGKIRDIFEYGLFITRRLQHRKIDAVMNYLEEMLAITGLDKKTTLLSSKAANAIIIGGWSRGVDAVKRAIDKLDSPTSKFTVEIKSILAPQFAVQACVTENEEFHHNFDFENHSQTVSAKPFLLSESDLIFLQYKNAFSTTTGKATISSTAGFENNKPACLATVGEDEKNQKSFWLKIELSEKRADKQKDDSIDDDSPSGNGNAFDNAFDSSF